MSTHQLSTKAQRNAADKAFQQSINHIRVALATKRMTTLGDVVRYLGIEDRLPINKGHPPAPLTVREFNFDILPLLERLHNNPPQPFAPPIEQPTDTAIDIPKLKDIDSVKSVYEEHPLDSHNWLPPRNPKQTAIQFPFQTKASKDLIHRLIIEGKRGVLLRASVGVGKTYIYGQMLRWMFDAGYFKGCISPWPALIITKASIVEQTRRVMANDFGLDSIKQVRVINFDALRSTKGLETMIDSRYEVHSGIRYQIFFWRPMLRPRVIIIDESQSAKNEDAQQSQIIARLEVPDDPLFKVVFSSATPFTRVSEAKYFVINAGIEWRVI